MLQFGTLPFGINKKYQGILSPTTLLRLKLPRV